MTIATIILGILGGILGFLILAPAAILLGIFIVFGIVLLVGAFVTIVGLIIMMIVVVGDYIWANLKCWFKRSKNKCLKS